MEACPTTHTDDLQQDGSSDHSITTSTQGNQASSCRRRVPAGTDPNRQQHTATRGNAARDVPTGKSHTGITDCVRRSDFDPDTVCTQPPRDELPEYDTGNSVCVAMSTGDSEMHVQDRNNSLSPGAVNSRSLTRFRSQSGRDEGEKHQHDPC